MPNWPEDAVNADYAHIVLDAIKNGDAEYRWTFIDSAWNGHTARIRVLEKPIKINGFYPGAGARLAQQVADLLGAVFMTARVSDLRFKQAATKIAPVFYDAMVDSNGNALPAFTNPDGSRGAPADMTKVYVMRLYAQYLDAAAKKAGYSGGVLGDCGKPWIIDNQLAATPSMAENYGFYQQQQPGPGHIPAMQIFEPGSLPGVAVVQGYWFPPAHSAAQTNDYGGDQADYSETLSGFMHRTMILDGKDGADVVDVASNPETCGLISVNGKPLTVFRQPNIPVYACPLGSKIVADEKGDMCPTPPVPSTSTSNGGGGGFPWIPLALGGAAAGIAYATRDKWMPPLRRLIRRF
jgi:hypothetical protein